MIATLALIVAFASTPQQAALQATSPSARAPVARAVRTNVDGNYAVVYVKGGSIEGTVVDMPFLLERFPFGWQPLDFLDDCVMPQRGFPAAMTAQLLRGMPRLRHEDCAKATTFIDAGPRSDVLALRERTRGPFVPSVTVAGNYALAEWYGAGGGEALWKRAGSSWNLVSRGGGAMNVDIVHAFGVPLSSMCALHVYDATCARRSRPTL